MINSIKEQVYSLSRLDLLFNILLGLALISSVIGTEIMGFFISLLVLWSLVWLVLNFKIVKNISYREWLVFLFLVLFFIWHQITRFIFAEVEVNGGGYAHFLLLIIPVYLHAKERIVSLKLLALFGCLAIFAALLSIVWQLLFTHNVRMNMILGGHEIMFGTFSLAITLLTTASLFSWGSSKKRTLIFMVTLVAGLYAVFVSGTRGAYIAIPVTLALLFIGDYLLHRDKAIVSIRLLVVSSILIFVIAFAVLQTNKGIYYKNKIVSLGGTISSVIDLDFQDSSFRKTHEGDQFRVIMLVIAWEMFKEKPLVGHGWGSYKEKKQQISEELGILGLYSKEHVDWFLGFNQPHNDYFRFASEQGIIGLFCLLILLFVPVYFFATSIINKNYSLILRQWSLVGLLFSIAYVHFYMTESISGRSGMFSHHLVLLVIILSQVVRLKSIEKINKI